MSWSHDLSALSTGDDTEYVVKATIKEEPAVTINKIKE